MGKGGQRLDILALDSYIGTTATRTDRNRGPKQKKDTQTSVLALASVKPPC